jgi:hypothetical protein
VALRDREIRHQEIANRYGPLNGLARHQVNVRLFGQHYGDLLRVAGSLLQRHTSASQPAVWALRSHARFLAWLARALELSNGPRPRSTCWTTATTSRSGGGS